ncbi:alpha-glucosidase C-terminal domain-containing protein [Butyrivibrio fibrisolvens]|uniref:alpha-glucosidase C-terminal domain-containing protein n=1 Tax=Butyrivibrio fibrisolvens TaxID=831 RepID=UPI003B50D304
MLSTGQNIFAFTRSYKDSTIICIYNLSKRQQSEFDLSQILTGDEEVLFSGVNGAYQEGGDNPFARDNLELTKDSNDYNLAATIGIIIFVISATFTLISFSRSNAIKNEEGFQ